MHFRHVLALLLVAIVGASAWATEITHEYTFAAPTITQVVIEGTTYSRLSMPNAPPGGAAGQPRLPARGASILVPWGEAVSDVQVTGEPVLIGSGYLVEPVGLPFAISEGPTDANIPRPDPVIYGSSAPFPAAPFLRLRTQSFRGYDILVLRLQPVKYIPATRQLYYYPTLHVTVETQTPGSGNALLRGLTEDAQAAASRVDNPETISTYPATRSRNGNDYDLLILTTQAYADAHVFDPLKDAHDLAGTPTQIKVFEGEPTWQNVRSFIHTEYGDPPLGQPGHIRYVLIGGGDDVLPAPRLLGPSDFYLGCLDEYGPEEEIDHRAEVYVGRAAADSTAEVTNFVNKTVAYIAGQHGHLDRVLQLGEMMESGLYAGPMLERLVNGSTEEEYTTVGIPCGPFTVDRLYDAEGPPAYRFPVNAVISRMNVGVHWVNHIGHGTPTWGLRLSTRAYPMTQTCGAAPVRDPVSDLDKLTNDDCFFIYSQACKCGWFDSAECLAERLTARSAHGAFAVIMNARQGFYGTSGAEGPSMHFHRSFWDAVFNPEHDPDPPGTDCSYGAANQYSKEQNLWRFIPPDPVPPEWHEEDYARQCFYELNLFGDPSLIMRTSP